MKQQEFIIKFYGKSELAMLYYDGDSPENAMSKFRLNTPLYPKGSADDSRRIRATLLRKGGK